MVCSFQIGWIDRRCLRKLMRLAAAQPPPYFLSPVAPRTWPEADSLALSENAFTPPRHAAITARCRKVPKKVREVAVTAKRKVVTYRKQASRMASFGAVRHDREPLSNPYQTHDLCPLNLCPPRRESGGSNGGGQSLTA